MNIPHSRSADTINEALSLIAESKTKLRELEFLSHWCTLVDLKNDAIKQLLLPKNAKLAAGATFVECASSLACDIQAVHAQCKTLDDSCYAAMQIGVQHLLTIYRADVVYYYDRKEQGNE